MKSVHLEVSTSWSHEVRTLWSHAASTSYGQYVIKPVQKSGRHNVSTKVRTWRSHYVL